MGVIVKSQGKFYTGAASGYSSSSIPFDLPIEFLSFDVGVEGDSVLLLWTTIKERNNDHFSIDRSRDGVQFTLIGEVDGSGNSDIEIDYNFIDDKPLKGISYYRLTQTGFDGQEFYTEVRLIMIEFTEGAVVFPNPIYEEDEYLSIQMSLSESQELQVLIFDSKGAVVLIKEEKSEAGLNQFRIPMRGYKPGVYFLKLIDVQGQSIGVQRVIKH